MELSQLVAKHKDTLDRLYKRCDESSNDDFDIAFKALDDYLETHNLSLATVSQIMGYGQSGLKDDFLELA